MIASKIVERVETFLGKKLPGKGLLTGQAVAEMYLEEIGFDNYESRKIKFCCETDFEYKISKSFVNYGFGFQRNTKVFRPRFIDFVNIPVSLKKSIIINDIDIFQISTEHVDKVLSIKLQNNICVDGYERIFYFDSYSKYDIISTVVDGDMNITSVRFPRPELANYKSIINMFDINTTQFGIDLATKEIIKSSAFDDFIKTGNMKIVNFSTPAHTYVRYLKKHSESKFRMLDTEIKKAVFNIHNGHGTRREKLYFSDKYKYLYQKYCLSHRSSQELMLECVLIPIEPEEQKYNLYKLQIRESVTGAYFTYVKEKLLSIGFKNFVNPDLNARMIDTVYIGSKKVIERNAEVFKEMDLSSDPSSVDFSLIAYKHLGENLDLNVLKRIHNSLKEHHILDLYFKFNSMKELSAFDKFVRGLVPVYGYSVWAYVEELRDILTEEEFMIGYDKFMNAHTENLKEPMFEPFETDLYFIKELTTSIQLIEEGSKMRHCVGGYAGSVANGNLIIVSIKNKSDRTQNSTLDLRFIKNRGGDGILFSTLTPEIKKEVEGALFVGQHMMFANKRVEEEDTKEILNLIKRKISKNIFSEKEFQQLRNQSSKDSFNLEQLHGFRGNNEILVDVDEDEMPF